MAALVINTFALHNYHAINLDVAFLTWAAEQQLESQVYGSDIFDVSPPLCMLIYMPAVFIGHVTGTEWGIRLWFMCLALLSTLALWHSADKQLRLPLCIVFVAFLTLAYPYQLAQREQIAFVLCAPYIAGGSPGRKGAVLNGVMAGIGFMLKPHFLIPLVLVVALRRRFGIEERAFLASGMAYAVILLVFFRDYVFEVVPAAAATYWAIGFPWTVKLVQGAFLVAVLGAMAVIAWPQRSSRPWLAAAAGFTAAGLLQNKGFLYHFIPAFGFLALFLVSVLAAPRRFVAISAAVFLLAQIMFHIAQVRAWFTYGMEPEEFRAALREEIGNSSSFITLGVDTGNVHVIAMPFQSRYLGTAISQVFIPAVASHANGAGRGNVESAERLAMNQALRELRRQPETVIVAENYQPAGQGVFNLLDWYKKNEEFRTLWSSYRLDRTVGPISFYRRK